MSADRLREAARVLRERATTARKGRWLAFRAHDQHPSGRDWIGVTTDLDVDYSTDVFSDQRTAAADATYIATMHPGVGLALADWLDIAANNAERDERLGGYAEAVRETPAMRLVDHILGGAA